MSKIIAAYGGGFKPPTAGHFEVVKKALDTYPEIDEFIIYVGSKVRNGLGQSESILIWDIFKKYLPMKVKIEPATSPIGDIIRLGKNNPDDKVYFIIGGREGRQDDLDDINSRTKNIEQAYPNMEVKIQTTLDKGMSGTNAREAAKISSDELSKYLPDELTDSEKKEVFDIVRPVVNEIKLPNITDLKSKFKTFLDKLKQEGKETKDAFNLLVQAAKGDKKLTDLDKQQIKEQLKDILKGVFGVTVFALPAGSLVLILLKLIKMQGIITPSSFLNENASYTKDINLIERLAQLTQHMLDKGMNIEPLPNLEFVNGDSENAREFLGKTAYYNPNTQTIVLYTEGRHPKDIARSYTHEMIHHIQNLEGRLGDIQTTNTQEDDNLNDIEAEANLKGTMTFRNWTDSLNEAIVGEKIECDNCGWSWNIVDGGDDLFICHKCGHDNSPLNEAKPYKHKHGFDDKLGKDPFGLNQFAREIAEGVLNEGRYDKLANKLSSIAFGAFKDIHDRGDKEGEFEFRVDHPDEEHDIPSKEFYFDFVGKVEITDDEYNVDGGANAGFDKNGDPITPLLSVDFKIPKNPKWSIISMDLKDVVRHELEHLTQDGDNEKGGVISDDPKLARPSKYMKDDQLVRDLIDSDMLSKSQYFKLEKEVDAMLQGLYFKAKKSKRPFKDVIDDYLNIFVNQKTITQEEKEDILNIWRSRNKALSLPIFENELDMDYKIFSDMDGVLTDFDGSFVKYSKGIQPRDYEKKFGKDGFWELIDGEGGVGFWAGMPWMEDGKEYWNYIKDYDTELLSSPSRSETSRLGKRLWVKNNMPGVKLTLAQAYNKKNYAEPNHILIDDRESNIEQWREAGGIGILHTSASDTINQLKALGL
jgi:hypothetical protein